MAAWSRLPGWRDVLGRLRPRLAAFRDERGRELFDLPDAPRPDPDTPAPPRFLPEYDNVLLSHADRSRFVLDEDRARVASAPGRVHGTVLLDGFAAGVWRIDHESGATLVVHHVGRGKRQAASLAAEGRRLLRHLEVESPHTVRLVPSADEKGISPMRSRVCRGMLRSRGGGLRRRFSPLVRVRTGGASCAAQREGFDDERDTRAAGA